MLVHSQSVHLTDIEVLPLLQMQAFERLKVLLQLPAVQQLSVATLLQLLQIAAEQQLYACVIQICRLPVLQEEEPSTGSSTAWLKILSAAIPAKRSLLSRGAVTALCALHAVRAAVSDAQALLPLLHAAVRSEDMGILRCLLQMPAAADVSSADAAAVVEKAAYSVPGLLAFSPLLQLPGVQAFDVKDLIRWVDIVRACNPRLQDRGIA
jgi:hypothetical protein